MNSRSEEKIICPWCGHEMFVPRPWLKGTPDMEGHNWTVRAKCRNCNAVSPDGSGRTEQGALNDMMRIALRRYTPPLKLMKPMTWDEFVRMTHPRLDGTEYPPVYVETAKAYSGRQGSWIIAKPNAIRVDTRYKPNRAFVDAHCVNLDALAYGKTWRCWERKPTDEERSAAEWEA